MLSQGLFASPYEVPPVPQLGGPIASSANFDLNGDLLSSQGFGQHQHSHSSNGTAANLIRQPRGPPTPGATETRNFALRSRVAVGGQAGSPPLAPVLNAGPISNGGPGAFGAVGQHHHSSSSSGSHQQPQFQGGPAFSFDTDRSRNSNSSHHGSSDAFDAQSHTPLEI